MTVATPTPRRWLLVPVVAATVLAGVVLAGRSSDDYKLAMAVTAAWMLVAGAAALAIGLRRRHLRLPVLGTYVLVAGAAFAYLLISSNVDKEVHEDVVTASPPAASAAAGAGDEASPPADDRDRGRDKPAGNVLLARGEFESGAHDTSGTASVVELPDGSRKLTLTNFETESGPDLRVYLSSGPDPGEHKDLAALKGNRGDQQYEIPKGVDLDRLGTAVIWCRAFSVRFGHAQLERSR